MVIVEAKRLTRLVENLLAYSRIADIADVYSFEPVDLAEFFEDLHSDFQLQLQEMRFEFRTEIPSGISAIRGDRLALRLLFDNLIANALRYSDQTRCLHVSASQEGGGRVRIEVTDAGIGIAEEELSQVTRKFVRGRRSPSGGSGLGLAIASRIATDHSGELHIRSVVSQGTTVTVILPIA
jgi:signal transduction histidine kinase